MTTKLPERALIDTGVFIRFLGERQDDRSEACKSFCDAMLDAGKTLLVAAPTVAEVCRQKGNPLPRTFGIVVVAFDDMAAEILGIQLPLAKLHVAKIKTGLSMTFLKYDAMIVATAIRARAEVIVSLDSDIPALAAGLIAVRTPADFRKAQMELSLARPPSTLVRAVDIDDAPASPPPPPPPSRFAAIEVEDEESSPDDPG